MRLSNKQKEVAVPLLLGSWDLGFVVLRLPTQKHFALFCAEPFDRTNTARSVFDYNAFRLIQTTFQNSLALLEATCDLDCLLPPYAASRRSF